MADAIVSFAVERLGDLLISESKLLYGVRDEINQLQVDLKRMQNFLIEADKRQIQDARVQGWVDEIKELAFRTEDVIEIFALQVATDSGFKEALRALACISCRLIDRHNIATDINDIKAKLANIHQSLPIFGVTEGLEQGGTSNPQVNSNMQRISFPQNVEKDFIGMEEEMEQLVYDLKKEVKGCEVVSIWGMGGQGKTTLAQELYNHVEIRDHFKAFAWVCISQQFDWRKVLKVILKQLLPDDREEQVSKMEDVKLVDELHKVQKEKNCLIVIDDIWTLDSWRRLKPAFTFPPGETTSSSKILLTTRNLKVAEKGSVCKVLGLKEDEGWQLLHAKARMCNQPDKRVALEMETIGRSMVRRCKGLPLAISTLGGILEGKHLLTDWEKINADITFYLAKGEGITDDDENYTVRQILGLSYDNLPSRLRHCFLCFANYKEDEVIKTEELYMFWMAEGLISAEDKAQGEVMLDVAERCMDELAHRSLVKVQTRNVEGESWLKYQECVVHDLIQDLCLSKVQEQGFINVVDFEGKRDNEFKANIVRRLCVRSYNANRDVLKPYTQHVISHIRSLSIWNEISVSVVWPDQFFSFEKFKLLRVLTVRGYTLSEQNTRSISELVYLKYLCLRYCYLKSLPSSIGKLRNLETLDIRSKDNYLSIPNVLWKLKMLKHLYLHHLVEVRGRAKKLRLEGLTALELIYHFNSEYCEAHDFLHLPNLRGFSGSFKVEENITTEKIIDFTKSRKLRCTNLRVTGREVSLVLLLECCYIIALEISGVDSRILTSVCVFPEVYDYTRLSGRITWLGLSRFKFEKDPMILLGNLPNLRRLTFYSNVYMGTEMVCSATSFLKLEYLKFDGFKDFRRWKVEKGAMPILSKLSVAFCSELEMLPEGLINLTSLESLTLTQMPTTFTDRVKVINGVKGEDFYKVRHIPRLYIKDMFF